MGRGLSAERKGSGVSPAAVGLRIAGQPLEFRFDLAPNGLAIVVSANDVGGFLASLLDGENLRIPVDLGLGWSSRSGFSFTGGAGFNGMPHPGHYLTRAIKDLFPRYRTMRGYLCERKAGWDTHGLPVEVEVWKELGIHAKEEIEAFGVEPFIHKCQESVWRYMKEWERLTERLGFWIHLEEAYVTYHQSYVESVWWSLKNLFERGLLYQGHKIVWWWAQGGTALSSGEVGQGYREVADPSVYVRFPLVDEAGTSLLVWTTTPWTLPSNQFAAVHPELPCPCS